MKQCLYNDQKEGKGLEERKMYQNSLIKPKWQSIPYFLVQSGILVRLLSASELQKIWNSTSVSSMINEYNFNLLEILENTCI